MNTSIFVRGLILTSAIFFMSCAGFGRIDYSRAFTRDGWQLPDRVIQELKLSPDMIVADIGAGEGYFSLKLARAVPRGKVFAVEVTDEKVAALKKGCGCGTPPKNHFIVEGNFKDPLLPEKVDLIFLVNTYHHIENRTAYFANVKKYLKPGGRIATIDHKHDMTGVMRLLLTSGHWSNPTVVRKEMAAAGFRETAMRDFLPNQYFQVFEPVTVQ